MVDIGGGTTDANVYQVKDVGNGQFRLTEELVPSIGKSLVLSSSLRMLTLHAGIICGASSLNAALSDFVQDLLKNEKYLLQKGPSLASIIHSKVVREFEHRLKRRVDFGNPSRSKMEFNIPDLRARDDDRRFTANYLVIYEYASTSAW